jgi:hypothetical protein
MGSEELVGNYAGWTSGLFRMDFNWFGLQDYSGWTSIGFRIVHEFTL